MIRKIKLLMNSFTMLIAMITLLININLLNAQWVSTGGPGPGSSVRCFAVSGANLFTGTWATSYYGGVFKSTNNGTNWVAINSGLTDTSVMALEVNGSYIFAGTINGGVFRSSNNGASWTSMNNGLTNPTVYSLGVNGSNIFAGTGDGVFRSTNDGISWDFTGLTGYLIFALKSIGPNLFAGTSGSGVFRTSNNGVNWIEVNTGLTNTGIQCLTVIGTNLYAGTFSGVFLTSNNGASWINTLGMAGTIVNTLCVSSTNLFAGSAGGGVHLSTNNGSNWIAVGTGIPNTEVNTLAISGTNIFAGTLSGIVYKRLLTEMISSVKLLSNDLPVGFILNQNYPNPFNPVTSVKYQIPKAAYVSIKLFDVLGRETLTLFEGDQKAGYYMLTVDGNNLASGIYFCRFNAADYSKVIKMSLIK
jgi:hypothetical protein